MSEQFTLDDFQRVDDFIAENPGKPWPTKKAFQWDYYNGDRNGLKACGAVVKRNGRLFVNKKALVEWFVKGYEAA